MTTSKITSDKWYKCIHAPKKCNDDYSTKLIGTVLKMKHYTAFILNLKTNKLSIILLTSFIYTYIIFFYDNKLNLIHIAHSLKKRNILILLSEFFFCYVQNNTRFTAWITMLLRMKQNKYMTKLSIRMKKKLAVVISFLAEIWRIPNSFNRFI